MAKYLHLFENTEDYTEEREDNYVKPWLSLIRDNDEVDYNKTRYEKAFNVPLTFIIRNSGTITWTLNNWNTGAGAATIQYNKNHSATWTNITSSKVGSPIDVRAGDIVQFRATGTTTTYGSSSYYNYFKVNAEGTKVMGNIMSLLNPTNFTTMTRLSASYCFYNLFNSSSGITDASELILPATTLTNYCYNGMFTNCISLKKAPKLPATTLKTACYQNMFNHCLSLKEAPELLATTLVTSCYARMFYECKSLEYVKCMATNPNSGYTAEWFGRASLYGNFEKANGVNWGQGVDRIPILWSTGDGLQTYKDEMMFGSAGATRTLIITSKHPCTATTNNSWLTPSILNKDSLTQTLVVTATSSQSNRNGEITVTNGYQTVTIDITQTNDAPSFIWLDWFPDGTLEEYEQPYDPEFVKSKYAYDYFTIYMRDYLNCPSLFGGNGYELTGEMTYEGEDFYLYECTVNSSQDTSYALMPKSYTYDYLYSKSSEKNITNAFCPFEYILGVDDNPHYGERETPADFKHCLAKVE